MNTQLDKAIARFKANKLSLKTSKTEISSFHSLKKKLEIPGNLPLLNSYTNLGVKLHYTTELSFTKYQGA